MNFRPPLIEFGEAKNLLGLDLLKAEFWHTVGKMVLPALMKSQSYKRKHGVPRILVWIVTLEMNIHTCIHPVLYTCRPSILFIIQHTLYIHTCAGIWHQAIDGCDIICPSIIFVCNMQCQFKVAFYFGSTLRSGWRDIRDSKYLCVQTYSSCTHTSHTSIVSTVDVVFILLNCLYGQDNIT